MNGQPDKRTADKKTGSFNRFKDRQREGWNTQTDGLKVGLADKQSGYQQTYGWMKEQTDR